MSTDKTLASADIRKRQGHPTIDADGHILEYRKIVLDYVDSLFGAKMRQEFLTWDEQAEPTRWAHAGPAERLNQRMGRPQFWATAAENTLDRATAVFPNLRRARMDELGIDYAILYPSAGLNYVNLPHDQFRPALEHQLPCAVSVSARTGTGARDLLRQIEGRLLDVRALAVSPHTERPATSS